MRVQGSRVVNVSSNLHKQVDSPVLMKENFDSEHGYEPWSGYARSKLANLLFTLELNRRLAAAGCWLHACCGC